VGARVQGGGESSLTYVGGGGWRKLQYDEFHVALFPNVLIK
jgi:hypothetical protein